MDEELNDIFESILVTESEKVPGTPEGELEGSEKAKAPTADKTADNDVEDPEEGLSQGEVKKGGASANKDEADVVQDSTDYNASSFESLYKSVIGEDEDIVSAPDVEGEAFNDEIGDFEADMEDDVDEETDIATELRTMSERLIELADRYGEPEEEMGDGEEDELGLGGDEDEDDVLESIKSEPEPKPHSPSPNRAKTAKGKLASVSGKKGKAGIKGTHTGEPSELGAKTGQKQTKGNTVKASGPSASKKATDAFC